MLAGSADLLLCFRDCLLVYGHDPPTTSRAYAARTDLRQFGQVS